MSAIDRILHAIRRVMVMEHKIQTLTDGVDGMAGTVLDHERRLVALETTLKLSRSNTLPNPDK
jgi:hypothetical protein